MKKLSLFLLLLVCLQAHADNWLKNGDFSEGIDHWRGNGRSPADFASGNPFDKPDPLLSKGLIIELKNTVWQKVQQDFRGKLSSAVLTLTYQVTDDTTFSTKAEDYANVPLHIDYDGWKAFDIPVQSWIVFITDFGTSKGTYYILKPNLGAKGPQTIKASLSALTPYSDKTICLAFPPGQGKVVILNISIEDK